MFASFWTATLIHNSAYDLRLCNKINIPVSGNPFRKVKDEKIFWKPFWNRIRTFFCIYYGFHPNPDSSFFPEFQGHRQLPGADP